MSDDPGGHYVTIRGRGLNDDGIARVEVNPFPVPDYEAALLRWCEEQGFAHVAARYRAHVAACEAEQSEPQDIACFVSEETGFSVLYPKPD